MMPKALRGFLVAILFLLLCLSFPVSVSAEVNMRGAYVEVGGVFFAPFAGEEVATGDPGSGFRQLETEPGGGFQIAGGYGFGFFSIGGKMYYAYLPEEPFGPPTGAPAGAFLTSLEADLWGMDVETRLFPLATLDSVVQPYLLAGLGWGIFNSDFKEADAVWSMNYGIGVQFLLTEHLYLAAEGSYRPVFGADSCGYQQDNWFGPVVYVCDGGEDLHIAQAAVNLGFRF